MRKKYFIQEQDVFETMDDGSRFHIGEVFDSFFEITCDDCEESLTVEPDFTGPCPCCGSEDAVSPLVLLELL